MNKQTKTTKNDQILAKLTLPELLMTQKASPVVVQNAVNEFGVRTYGADWKQRAQAQLDQMGN